MAKQKFPRVTTPVGVARFPYLRKPDTQFNPDGDYKCDLLLTPDEAEGMIEKLESIRDAFYDEKIKEHAKFKRFTKADVFIEELDRDTAEPTGSLIFRTKLKAMVRPKNGEAFAQAPRLFDASNKPLPKNVDVWGGSRVALAVEVVPYAMESSKTIGVSLRLKAVQVVELRSGGGNDGADFGFGATDGYTAPAEESFNDFSEGADEDDGNDDF